MFMQRLILILLLALAPAASSGKTVADWLASSDEHRVFLTMLEASGLLEQLKDEGPFTVFAPTDRAFAKLGDGGFVALMRPEHRGELVAMLRYHVVPTKVSASSLRSHSVMTLQGQPLKVEVENGKLALQESEPVSVERVLQNGVIYSVEQVLKP
jgi:uncharacterized surface protein with fasciclin (FAS1) repeats